MGSRTDHTVDNPDGCLIQRSDAFTAGQQSNWVRARILVQVTIRRRLLIGRDGRLDQSGAYDVS